MKQICLLALAFLFWGTSLGAHAAIPDSLLTERTIRAIYVNYPDSALLLLDEAEERRASGISPLRIDQLRALCYEIKGDLSQKEICIRRALQNDSIRLTPKRKLPFMVMLASVLERQNRYEECIVVCRETIDLARNMSRRMEEAEMYSVMARVSVGMVNSEKAEEYFKQAVELLAGTDNVREMAFLSTFYGEYISFLINQKRTAEAIEIGYRRETVIQRMSELPGPPPGYIDQQYGFLYAKMALLLYENGDKEEAGEIFKKYKSTHFSQTIAGKQYTIPYLLEASRYAEAAILADTCLSVYANDTVNYEYQLLLAYRARASRGMKRFDLADVFMQRCSVLQDSIYTRESASKAQEYASKFDLKEKELQLTKSRALSEKRMMLLAGLCILLTLLFVILWITYMNLQKNKQRNRIAAKQIDELLSQREELRKLFAQKQVAAAGNVVANKPEEAASTVGAEEVPETDKDEDYARFMKMESILVGQKLFLKPGFGRDELVEVAGLNKNGLGPLLRKYTDADNLTDYLNGLRIEYSIKLMKSKPHLSIDAIAVEANFNSRSTFYRAFVKVWGMTPVQYMRTKME